MNRRYGPWTSATARRTTAWLTVVVVMSMTLPVATASLGTAAQTEDDGNGCTLDYVREGIVPAAKEYKQNLEGDPFNAIAHTGTFANETASSSNDFVWCVV